jgi:type IV fimbrial biogenesis protein FimT
MDRRLAQYVLGHPQGWNLLVKPARPQRGFTLVEIFIAIAIVSMLILLAAPSTANWIQNTRLRSAAEAISRGLQTARVEAMKRNTVVAFNLTDTNSSAFTVCLYDPVNNICQTATGSVLLQRDASEDGSATKVGVDTTLSDPTVAITGGTNVPGTTAFDWYGRLAATAPNQVMRIDVRNPTLAPNDERRLVIFINQTGQIRVCDPRLSKAVNPQGCQ